MIEILADIVRLVTGIYLLYTAIFKEVPDVGVRYGVALLLLASVGGF